MSIPQPINAPGKWYDGLTVRAMNCIMCNLALGPRESDETYEEWRERAVVTPAAVAEKGRLFWMGHPNAGKKTVALIEQWLNKHGFEWEPEPVLKQHRGEQHSVTRELVAGRWHYFCTVCNRSLSPDSPWREDCPGFLRSYD